MTSITAKAVKYDEGKPQLSLLNQEFLIGVARVLEYGAIKYGRDNYKQGMNWTRVLDALLRHIFAFISGEDLDAESGLPHMHHAGACVAMLCYYIGQNKGKDDRAAE